VTEAEIYSGLSARFGEKLLSFQDEETSNPAAMVEAGAVAEIMTYLKGSEDLAFDQLMCLSGYDAGPELKLGVIYHLYSTSLDHYFTIKTEVDRESPEIPSVAALWATADWHEREVYDMYGVSFKNHPDLKRILLEDDWEGFPLRKDYVAAETYRGMKIAKEK